MNPILEAPAVAEAATAPRSIFLPPWDAMSDDALLAFYRSPRAVQYGTVVDADETRPEKIEALMQGRFEFNHETHGLAEPIDWLTNPSRDVEWHILLHKFYYAVGLSLAYERSGAARYARRWQALIGSWMRSVPPGFIAADVTGRRVQNWIYSYRQFVTHAARPAPIDPAFHRALLQSIHEQVDHLCEHLTPKRNHRTLELLAIFLAGVVFPEMRRAAHWRAFALEQMLANVEADLLADGVHCELSTDYHHLVLKNLLNFRRLAAGNGVAVPAAMDQALQRALEFSLHVHKPDGLVPSLSDGDSRGFLELLAQGAELFGREDMRYVATRGAAGRPPRDRVAHFDASGYSVLRNSWGGGAGDFADAQHLIFDCGPLGEGNHGHFDALSFELAAFGRSLIVDPGRYTYSEEVRDGVNWRVHFRGTAAHNTVCVDGLHQTRYEPKPVKDGTRHAAGSVRHKIVGPAAEARLIERWHGPRLDLLHGEVRSPAYDALHSRCIVFVDREYWIVSDWLQAASEHDYRLNFQLGAPAWGRYELSLTEGMRLRSPGLLMLQPARAGVSHAIEEGWVSARYGHKERAPALRSRQHARDAAFDTVLMPWHEQEPQVTVTELPVAGSAAALRITRHDHGVSDTWFHSHDDVPRERRIDGLVLQGRWAFWRCAADGRLLHAVSHHGAQLTRDGAAIVPDAEDPR